MDITRLRNHITFTSHDDVKKICMPLFDLGIAFFDYVKVYKDRSRLHLGNNPEWVKYFFQNHYQEKLLYFEDFSHIRQGTNISNINLWNNAYSNYEIARSISEQFGLTGGNVITIKSCEEYIENFYIAADIDNKNIFNIYANQFNLIERFIFYFRDKAKRLIIKANQNRLNSPDNEQGCIKITQNESLVDIFFKQTETNRFYLTGVYEGIYLTRKELQCINLLASGKDFNQIASILNCTSRTIEAHIQNVKDKLHCTKIAQAIYLLTNQSIIK